MREINGRITALPYTQGMRYDPTRLAELRRSQILDSAPERAYDDLTHLLANALDVPIVMINLLDGERDWFKSSVGITQKESPAITSFCEIFFAEEEDLIVVEDTLQHPRYASHALVVNAPFIRFYVGARLTSNGHTLGTLCAYDLRPRKISAEQIKQMRLLSFAAIALISESLELGREPA